MQYEQRAHPPCPYPECPYGDAVKIGNKPRWWWYIITPTVAATFAFFAWQVSGANSREVRIKALETQQAALREDVAEIKGDVKRLVWLKEEELRQERLTNPGPSRSR